VLQTARRSPPAALSTVGGRSGTQNVSGATNGRALGTGDLPQYEDDHDRHHDQQARRQPVHQSKPTHNHGSPKRTGDQWDGRPVESGVCACVLSTQPKPKREQLPSAAGKISRVNAAVWNGRQPFRRGPDRRPAGNETCIAVTSTLGEGSLPATQDNGKASALFNEWSGPASRPRRPTPSSAPSGGGLSGIEECRSSLALRPRHKVGAGPLSRLADQALSICGPCRRDTARPRGQYARKDAQGRRLSFIFRNVTVRLHPSVSQGRTARQDKTGTAYWLVSVETVGAPACSRRAKVLRMIGCLMTLSLTATLDNVATMGAHYYWLPMGPSNNRFTRG